jgi:hypothetical protein
MICNFNFFSIRTNSLLLICTLSNSLPAKLPEAPSLFKERVTTERIKLADQNEELKEALLSITSTL